MTRTLDPSTRVYVAPADESTPKNNQPKEPNILDRTLEVLRKNPYIFVAVVSAFMIGYIIASKREHKLCNAYTKSRAQLKSIQGTPSVYQQMMAAQMPKQITLQPTHRRSLSKIQFLLVVLNNCWFIAIIEL